MKQMLCQCKIYGAMFADHCYHMATVANTPGIFTNTLHLEYRLTDTKTDEEQRAY